MLLQWNGKDLHNNQPNQERTIREVLTWQTIRIKAVKAAAGARVVVEAKAAVVVAADAKAKAIK
jgi:hypothetical protein